MKFPSLINSSVKPGLWITVVNVLPAVTLKPSLREKLLTLYRPDPTLFIIFIIQKKLVKLYIFSCWYNRGKIKVEISSLNVSLCNFWCKCILILPFFFSESCMWWLLCLSVCFFLDWLCFSFSPALLMWNTLA